MNTNAKFTKDPIGKTVKPLVGAKMIVDDNGALLCFLRKDKLYDINHVFFARCKRVGDANATADAFVTDGRHLYRNGQREGSVKSNLFRNLVITLVLLLILASVVFAVVAVEFSKPIVPEFTVVDTDGTWGATDKIDIFGSEQIKPGDKGRYSFMVNNPTVADLKCTIRFKLKYADNTILPKIDYLLESAGQSLALTETDDGFEVEDVVIYKDSSRSFYLQWEWKFDNDNDNHDTVVGIVGAEYEVTIVITAETITK